jgi:hypothetical protein
MEFLSSEIHLITFHIGSKSHILFLLTIRYDYIVKKMNS